MKLFHFQLIFNTNLQNFMKWVTNKVKIVPITEVGRPLLTKIKNSKMSMLEYVEFKHLEDKL